MQQEGSLPAFPHFLWESLLSVDLASAENYFANPIVLNQNVWHLKHTEMAHFSLHYVSISVLYMCLHYNMFCDMSGTM